VTQFFMHALRDELPPGSRPAQVRYARTRLAAIKTAANSSSLLEGIGLSCSDAYDGRV